MRKHKADQVLSLLLNRARVEAGGNTYCMREDHSLALVMPLKETSVEVVIGMDMDLKRFVDLCEAVPENELFIMAAQQALRELHSHG